MFSFGLAFLFCLYSSYPWHTDLWIICFSGNYGGALGANALAKGLEGNKSLRVQKFPHVSFYVYRIPSLYYEKHFIGRCVILYDALKVISDLIKDNQWINVINSWSDPLAFLPAGTSFAWKLYWRWRDSCFDGWSIFPQRFFNRTLSIRLC